IQRRMAVRAWLAPPPRPDAPGPGPRYGARSVTRGDTLLALPCLRVLWPPDSVRRTSGMSDNQTGVALELSCDTTRALLLADLDTLCEARLLLRHQAVLKLGHHGSRTATSATLLAATDPQIALVSCGRWNHFGHPHR